MTGLEPDYSSCNPAHDSDDSPPLAATLSPAATTQPAVKAEAVPIGLERKLRGELGGACVGTLTFWANGTFERRQFSPGNHELTGTWEVRWDALPPTLGLTCKDSDSPRHIGTKAEVKLVQPDDTALALLHLGSDQPVSYKRVKK